ncbi:MAG: hypothetical protein QM770_08080 [Tepidisphaeraceae bacterium]
MLLTSDLAWVGQTVYDLNTCQPVGKYNVEPAAYTQSSGLFWAVSKAGGREGQRMLCSWKLPGEPVLNAAKQAKPAEQLKLGAGTAVSLEVAIEGTEEQRQEIVKLLTKDLNSRGVQVRDGLTTKLVVRTEDGKSEQRTYQTMGGAPWNRETNTVTVTQKITRVFVERDGKNLWETTATSGAGFILTRKEGQSMQDAVNEQARANLGFVKSVRVPDVIPLNASTEGLLLGQLVPGGVKMSKR